MASNRVSMLSSPVPVKARDVFQEKGCLSRSLSGKDLTKGMNVKFHRSYSDNNLCYSPNKIRASAADRKLAYSRSTGILPFQISGSFIPDSLRSFLFDSDGAKETSIADDGDVSLEGDHCDENGKGDEKVKRANWIERLLEIRGRWRSNQPKSSAGGEEDEADTRSSDQGGVVYDCPYDEGICEADYGSDEEGETNKVEYDRESFSDLLNKVPLSDLKLFSQLAFLSNMAYVIPTLRAEDLRRYYGLRFVTSSIGRKDEVAAINAKFDKDSTRPPVASTNNISDDAPADGEYKPSISPHVAYDIAASAASYVQSLSKDLSSDGTYSDLMKAGSDLFEGIQSEDEASDNGNKVYNSEVAAYMAASTMTAVVAAGEEEKQEAARKLQSLHSSPCEWFVCDDLSTYTRCFVIQGSDSLASWQANLFFEPTKFEETEGLVHRGIYEAAKGMYQQFLPEIMEHLNKHGDRAKFQFTGHSLGGSLALLVDLMLLARKAVKPSNLRPVVTFGSPFVFCGGQKVLSQLGVDEGHVHCVMMHRDIVPRAFSCSYPDQIAVLLKRLTGSFRSHPCLIRNKLLYTPLGEVFIIQPDEKWSPPHPLLPPGSGIYALEKKRSKSRGNAIRAFLNNPHPLVMLSDPTAYGSEGSILRDHDSSNYLKTVNEILRGSTKMHRRGRKERDGIGMWPLLTSPSPHQWSYESNMGRSSSRRRLGSEVLTGA
ncbi:hypothetical protein MLD38_023437 [Melastoma candidum]|uniref:Uncharacterized protein n=1 Tax=Melastoma candidum TaxID=119954 RepID=A0ACB9NQC2_9MYRT|nr:hypothetical protein MLD38_023437 [Melastoma candidum]